MTTITADSEYLSTTFDGLKMPEDTIADKEFDSCTFSNCDFSDAVFSRCRFIDCDFRNCNLSLAKLEFSRFSEVSFVECKVVGVDWTKAAWPGLALVSPLQFDNCILNEGSFFGLKLAELGLHNCKAHNVDFRDADLSQANLTATDFTASLFAHTNLSEADFSEATGFDIDIHNNELRGAIFSRYDAVRLLDSLDIVLVE